MIAWLAGAAAGQPADAPVEAEVASDGQPEAAGEVIVIEAGPPPRANAAETTIDGQEGARIAGVQGDAIKAVRTLGGVARAAAGTDGIIVWGASPADTRLYVDDVPVPRLFHLGGSRSILPTSLVSALTLVPGGAGARYGRAIGGLVSVVTAAPGAGYLSERAGGYASADPIDVGAGAHAFVGDDSWAAISGRHSLLGQTFEAVAPARASELVPIPDYWDYQARAGHRLPNGDELRVIAFGTGDMVTRGIPSITPDDDFRETVDSQFHRVGARVTRRRLDDTTMVLSVWSGIDRDRQRLEFGAGGVTALQDRDAFAAGINLSEERRVDARVLVRFGVDLELRRTAFDRDGAISLPGREGDVGYFGQPPGDRVNRDRWAVREAGVGAYVSGEIDAGAGIRVEPGVRFEPGVIDGNRVLPVRPTEPAVGYTDLQFAIDPRLRALWTPRPALQVYGAAGRYHQAPAAADLSPIFGSPVLSQARAWQGLLGVIALPRPWLTAELVGFGVSQRALAVRTDVPTPAIAGLLESVGRGRTMGTQLSVRARPPGGLIAWMSYSLMRSQRRGDGDDGWRAFDGDQTHLLQAAAGWSHASGLELGARVEVASGAPRTDVVGSVWNSTSQRYDPIFGDHNGMRLPLFASLSLRAAWGRRVAWGRYKMWLDVHNVTNRANAEEVFYTADFARRGYVRGLPILPTLGLEAEL